MNPDGSKQHGNDPDPLKERQKNIGTDQGRDNEDLDSAGTPLMPERHAEGILSEIDGGGVQFAPEAPATPSVANDPKNPASKPQGTTSDQITTMESEGQAQQPVEPEAAVPETLDEQAMDQADEAGSAILEHDKVLRQPKR